MGIRARFRHSLVLHLISLRGSCRETQPLFTSLPKAEDEVSSVSSAVSQATSRTLDDVLHFLLSRASERSHIVRFGAYNTKLFILSFSSCLLDITPTIPHLHRILSPYLNFSDAWRHGDY